MTNQTVTGSRLTGYIVNVMRSSVIERLMVRGSQVAIMIDNDYDHSTHMNTPPSPPPHAQSNEQHNVFTL